LATWIGQRCTGLWPSSKQTGWSRPALIAGVAARRGVSIVLPSLASGPFGLGKEEHDQLGRVLQRYRATGSGDAVLAEVEGGWAAAIGYGWSSLSSTSDGLRRLVPTDTEPTPAAGVPSVARGRFELVPDRSVVLVEVRSTAGPLSFGSIGLTGHIEASMADGVVQTEPPPSARIVIDVAGLRSGNRLYDAELLRRIDARAFPEATVELHSCTHCGPGSRYLLGGELTFHGETRPACGTVSVEAASDTRLVITGEQTFDIRDFAIPSPTVLILRIYPDVRVRLHAEAELGRPETDHAGAMRYPHQSEAGPMSARPLSLEDVG
jgi:polyisoprenoid-binding protein YceI